MAKLTNYNGSVSLMAGITQKGGGDFPLIEANAVQVDEEGGRLDAKLADLENRIGGGGGSNITIDQTYDPNSENAISGKGVAAALEDFKEQYIYPLVQIAAKLTFSMQSGGIIDFNESALVGTYNINWGDGTSNLEFSHEYAQAGDYTVILYNTYNFGSQCVRVSEGSYLTKLIIQNGVLQIDTNAFAEHIQLSNVEILNQNVNIDKGAFFGCYELKEMTLQSIGTNNYPLGYFFGEIPFYQSEAILQNFLNSNGELSSATYYIPTNLKKIIISSKIIPFGWLWGCKNLTSIMLEQEVEKIQNNAFYGCRGLTEIHYNATKCEDLTSINHIFEYAGQDSEGIVVIVGSSVKRIPAELFCPYDPPEAPKITKVTFEKGSICESIGQNAFKNCVKLMETTIPDNVTSIEEFAFYHCTGLTKIYYHAIECEDLTFSSNIFAYAGQNEEGILVTIGSNVKKIPAYLFHSSSSPKITSVVFEENSACKSIGNYAFRGCSSLTSVEILDSATSIGMNTFDSCSGLISVKMGDNVTSIGPYAFVGCSSLTSVGMPDSVTSVGEYAFYWCAGLTSVVIGDGVTSIGYSAFAYCSNLEAITIGEGVTRICKSTFDNCTNLTSVIIPNNVETIETLAFAYCENLATIIIPKSVTTIASAVFIRNGDTLLTVNTEYSSKPGGWAEDWNYLNSDGSFRAKVEWASAEPTMMSTWSLRPSEPDTEIFYGNIQVNNDIIVTYNDEQYSLVKILELLGGYFDDAKI